MHNPAYLTQSRHNVFYFRFPIPSALHPQNKASDIRLSLQTRCPQEALRLARSLFTFGDIIIRNPVVQSMNYQELRDRLTEYFKGRLEAFREKRAINGPLTDEQIQNFHTIIGYDLEVIKGNYDGVYGMDYHEEIAEWMKNVSASYEQGTPEYHMFCKTYAQAHRDYCKAALEINEKLDSFNYTHPHSIVGKKALPQGKQKKLADTINQYMEEKQRLGTWRGKTAEGIRAQFDLLLEYLGPDASLHMNHDTANNVKAMIMALPKYARSKDQFKKMPIQELSLACIPCYRGVGCVRRQGCQQHTDFGSMPDGDRE